MVMSALNSTPPLLEVPLCPHLWHVKHSRSSAPASSQELPHIAREASSLTRCSSSLIGSLDGDRPTCTKISRTGILSFRLVVIFLIGNSEYI